MMVGERVVAWDIGGGTQDILLYEPGMALEGAYKLVVPSPTRVVAGRVRAATAQGRDVWLSGWLMGGGPLGRAVQEHLRAGLKVFATPDAARSLSDDLERVRAMGVVLTEDRPPAAVEVRTTDVDTRWLEQVVEGVGMKLARRFLVAVCDHGYRPGVSDRLTRFEMWRQLVEAGGEMKRMITADPPAHMTRMRAIVQQLPGAMVMDTAAAAVWGALMDERVGRLAEQGVCVVNIGNMHTVGFLVEGRRIRAVWEHHTRLLNPPRLSEQAQQFMLGELRHEQVFAEGGHGCAYGQWQPRRVEVVVTGPRRAMACGLGWTVATAYGDSMIPGCFGLLGAAGVVEKP